MTYNVFGGTLNPAQSNPFNNRSLKVSKIWRNFISFFTENFISCLCYQVMETSAMRIRPGQDRFEPVNGVVEPSLASLQHWDHPTGPTSFDNEPQFKIMPGTQINK